MWILYTNRERKREITRNGETPRGWKTEKNLYILIVWEASRFHNQCVRSGRTEVKDAWYSTKPLWKRCTDFKVNWILKSKGLFKYALQLPTEFTSWLNYYTRIDSFILMDLFPVSSQIRTLVSNTLSLTSTLNININNANILQNTIAIVYFL